MKSNSIGLHKLLMLETNWFTKEDALQVRAQIGQDSKLQDQWKSVRHVADQLMLLRSGKSFELFDELKPNVKVDAQIIAAYVEGTLDAKRTSKLESVCLQYPAMLAELISVFRSYVRTFRQIRVPERLTQRLLQLADNWNQPSVFDDRANIAEQANVDSRFQPGRTRSKNGSPAPLEPVVLGSNPIVNVSKSSRGLRKPIRRRLFSAENVGVGTAVCLLIAVVVTVWYSMPGSNRTGPIASNNPTAPAVASPEIEKQFVQQPDSPALDTNIEPKVEMPAFSLFGSDESEISKVTNPTLVEMDIDSMKDESNSDKTQQSPGKSDIESSAIAGFKWEVIEGMVALRSAGSTTWFGPMANQTINSGLVWATLPASWASAQLGTIGEIVIDGDSAAEIQASPERNAVAALINHGRIAFKKVQAGVTARITYCGAAWDVKVEEASTTFGCDWHQDCPRLFVKRGGVRVGDVMVRSDEQISWVAGRSLVAEKIQGKLAWLDKPQQKSSVPKAFREKMLASVDFIGDLDKPETIGNRGPIVLAQQWSAALEPEKGLMPVLENADARIRRDAVAWLVTLPPKHPRTRLMWRIISVQAGAPEFTRSFFRMTQLARAAAPISLEDATLLLRGLEHDRLFVRQVSQLFLETGFGNLGNYQADAPPEIRRQTIDAWTREINQRYTATRGQ